MQPNSNIYGSESSFNDINDMPNRIKSGVTDINLKFPFYLATDGGNIGSIYSGLATGSIPFNTSLDKSICPWGISANSDFANLFYPTCWLSEGGRYLYGQSTIQEAMKENYIPVMFSADNGNMGTNYTETYNYTCVFNKFGMGQDYTDLAAEYKYICPVTAFKYNEMIMLVYIRAGSYTSTGYASTSTRTFTVEEYFNETANYSHLTHPLIYNIWGELWFASETENESGSITRNSNNAYHLVNMGRYKKYDVRYTGFNNTRYFFMRSDNSENYITGNSATYPILIAGQIPEFNCYKLIMGRSNGQHNCDTLESAFAYLYSCQNGSATAESSNRDQLVRMPLVSGSPSRWKLLVEGAPYSSNDEYDTQIKMRYVWEGATKEEVYEQAAYMGFWFTGTTSSARTSKIGSGCTDENVHIPIFDSSGITTGQYSSGTAAAAEPNANWSNPFSSNSGFDPTRGIDPNEYSEVTQFSEINIASSAFTQHYIVTAGTLYGLGKEFYDAMDAKPSDTTSQDYSLDTFLTNNPADVIVSLKKFPLDLSGYGFDAPIKLGKYVSTARGNQVSNGFSVQLYDLGSCEYFKHFDDFRDYKPYSHAELIIPFCGSVQIDPAEFMGHTIRVYMAIDFITGACTAYVLKDYLVINSAVGTCAVDLPISAVNLATIESQLFNGSQQLKAAKLNEGVQILSAAFNVAGSVAAATEAPSVSSVAGAGETISKSIGNIAGSVIDKQTAEYNLEHTQIPFRQIGGNSPLNNCKQELNARLIVYRPIMHEEYNEAEYGHNTGYATLENTTLANFTGYTQVATIDTTGITATEAEKKIIKNLAQTGIYL